jgi:response regulator of citrate/malate metabolism
MPEVQTGDDIVPKLHCWPRRAASLKTNAQVHQRVADARVAMQQQQQQHPQEPCSAAADMLLMPHLMQQLHHQQHLAAATAAD